LLCLLWTWCQINRGFARVICQDNNLFSHRMTNIHENGMILQALDLC